MIYNQEYFDFQTSRRSWLRQIVRNIFLRSAVALARGKTVDFGCGAGELLKCLPAGSVGIEVNPQCVKFLQKTGYDCRHCKPEEDDFRLLMLSPEDEIQTLICSHVLEHLADPGRALCRLGEACGRLGIGRMVFIVPDMAGFKSHFAHVTYCNEETFSETDISGFTLVKMRHFPFRFRVFQDHFVGNELHVVYEARN